MIILYNLKFTTLLIPQLFSITHKRIFIHFFVFKRFNHEKINILKNQKMFLLFHREKISLEKIFTPLIKSTNPNPIIFIILLSNHKWWHSFFFHRQWYIYIIYTHHLYLLHHTYNFPCTINLNWKSLIWCEKGYIYYISRYIQAIKSKWNEY